MSTEDALRTLLDARYGRGSTGEPTLSEKDYQLARNRLKKPYDSDIAAKLSDVMVQKEEEIFKLEHSPLWGEATRQDSTYTDKEKAKVAAKSAQVNAQLLDWVDKKLSISPDWIPEPKELYQMKKQTEVSVPEPKKEVSENPDKYTVGQKVSVEGIIYTYKGNGIWSY